MGYKFARIIIGYALALSMLLPFLWMVSTSFKSPGDVFEYPINWIPDPFTWNNYRSVLTIPLLGVSFITFYINSVKVVVLVLIGTFFSCSLAAYAYSKIKFPGRDTLFLIKVSTMMIPFQILMLPTFIIFRELGLLDTLASLWLLSFFGASFGVFLLKQFYLSIPESLSEAARIDGAGHLRIYWSLILPLTKPAMTVLLVLVFVGTWNNYEMPLLYIRSPELFTIPIGLKVMSDDIYTINYANMMAGVVLSVIPIFLMFTFAQKYFIEGVVFTGVKE